MSLTYVLVTAAHNEEGYIEKTIHSVMSQTIKPLKWVIVNDGSTDGTAGIVETYSRKADWIELYNMPKRAERHFAGKAIAFNKGCDRLSNLPYGLIGNLDADISFGPDYFEYLIDKFNKISELGVAGTHYVENGFHSFKDSYINVNHVNGQCQLFRRQCFEEIGGYVPIKGGGIDWIAVTTARMRGWKTYSFDGRVFFHHRVMGTAGSNVYISRYNYGKKDYFLGNHPLWELFRGVYQLIKKPYVLGGMFLMSGYISAWAIREKRPISAEVIKFHRKEQLKRLKELFRHRFIILLKTDDRSNTY